MFDYGVMANGRYCVRCKKITDRLYQAAKAQNKSKWLSETLADPPKAQELVQSYIEKFPDEKVAKVANQTGKFLTTFREEVEAVSGVVLESDGIMVDEESRQKLGVVLFLHVAESHRIEAWQESARISFFD